MRRLIMTVSLILLAASGLLPALEDSFLEKFALADREARQALLLQLPPGSEDYYYYHCLFYQQTGRLAEAREILAKWRLNLSGSDRRKEMETRQLLLNYQDQPRETLAALGRHLQLDFSAEPPAGRETDAGKALPSRLPPELLQVEARWQEFLKPDSGGLENFTGEAYAWLSGQPLSTGQRRELLQKITRPDLPGLAKLVMADLAAYSGQSFGSLPVHRLLTGEQLAECLVINSNLIKDKEYVNCRLQQLRPGSEDDWLRRPDRREAYLRRLWEFVEPLPPVYNSIKALILYHRLRLDQSTGQYEWPRLLAYLRLPRQNSYSGSIAEGAASGTLCDLDADYSGITGLPPVHDDETLVRDLLARFFLAGHGPEELAGLIRENYLLRLQAETMLLAGQGDSARWAARFSPDELEMLRKREVLAFTPQNRQEFQPEDSPWMELAVKNIPRLRIRVHAINLPAWYQATGREIGAGADLEGLTPAFEREVAFPEPDFRQVVRRFDFPELTGRGAWIIDFLGRTLRVRALVRKGALQCIHRLCATGYLCQVRDETGRLAEGAVIRLGAREYRAGAGGEILLPFGSLEGTRTVVLEAGGTAGLYAFQTAPVEFSLSAAMHLEQEQLLPGQTATAAIRPRLCLGDTPVAISLLQEPRLAITATSLDGVSSTMEIRDLKLTDEAALAHVFRVPDRLREIKFTLYGKLRHPAGGQEVELETSRTFQINGIALTAFTAAVHLQRSAAGYTLLVLGRNGEPQPGVRLDLSLQHRWLRPFLAIRLQADELGRIELGPLPGVQSIGAYYAGSQASAWTLETEGAEFPGAVGGLAGQPLVLPAPPRPAGWTGPVATLLERRGETWIRDWSSAIAAGDGELMLSGLPAGDYVLVLKTTGQTVDVHISGGAAAAGVMVAPTRLVEVRKTEPLRIAALEEQADSVLIRLRGAGRFTRVYAAAGWFWPAFAAGPGLRLEPAVPPDIQERLFGGNQYGLAAGLDDEYRYILERQAVTPLPGNTLPRPGLLLNPMELGKPEISSSSGGGVIGGVPGGAIGPSAFSPKDVEARGFRQAWNAFDKGIPGFTSLDFLKEPGMLLLNLEPDAGGTVRIPRSALGGRPLLTVVAADPEQTVWRQLALAAALLPLADRRLTAPLPLDQPLASRREVRAVPPGQSIPPPETGTGQSRLYSSLEELFQLYITLCPDPGLAEFAFLSRWPSLSPAGQDTLYSRYASHEVNFFLSRHDPAFFRRVIQPYLSNKKDKTFLDEYLLELPLDGWREPARFARLNVLERILLARRIPAGQEPLLAWLKNRLAMEKPDPAGEDAIFAAALAGRQLAVPDDSKVMEKPDGVPPPPPPAPSPVAAQKAMDEVVAVETEEAAKQEEYFADGVESMAEVPVLYSPVGDVIRWGERNYYQDAGGQGPGLPLEPFWLEAAKLAPGELFLPAAVAGPARTFSGALLALALVDLPFAAGPGPEGAEPSGPSGRPAILFRQSVESAALPAGEPEILITGHIGRINPLTRKFAMSDGSSGKAEENDQDREIASTDWSPREFIAGVPYLCETVLANPAGREQAIDLLLQIPAGAIPLEGSQATRTIPLVLAPYETKRVSCAFYFPVPGEFGQTPVRAGRRGVMLACTMPILYRVTAVPGQVDEASWSDVAGRGTNAQVKAFLEKNNPLGVDLGLITWRLADASFYRMLAGLLDRQHHFVPAVAAWSIYHRDEPGIRAYLARHPGLSKSCGPWFESPLLAVEPVHSGLYRHIEFAPLVYARTHRFAAGAELPVAEVGEQYQRFLDVLAHQPRLSPADRLETAYYLLLQDRLEDGRRIFTGIDPAGLETRLQYDYLAAWLDFFNDPPLRARQLASRYKDFPVARWRELFQTIQGQLDEIDGRVPAAAPAEDRRRQQEVLAGREPQLELMVEGGQIVLEHRNLAGCTLHFYPLEMELLFSQTPFDLELEDRQPLVRPAYSQSVTFSGTGNLVLPLPERFRQSHVLVEAAGAGLVRRKLAAACSFTVQLIENYGQLKVTRTGGAPLPAVYVKVYRQSGSGDVTFFKDGYTDLRGRFDYATVSGESLDGVKRFAILILGRTEGAAVRMAAPPAR